MRNLGYYAENPLDDPNISMNELIAFSSDHQERMVSNNPGGLFDDRIAATAAAFQAVESVFTDDKTKTAIRKARKQAKDAFRKTLLVEMAKIHGQVIGKFGPSAVQVTECFPGGRKVFSTVPDDELNNELQQVVNGLTAHATELGQPLVQAGQTLLDNWIAVHGASETSTGKKVATQEAKNLARQNLQLELFKNLLTIALKFPRQPEKVALYMQQSLLEDHPAQTEEPPTPPTP